MNLIIYEIFQPQAFFLAQENQKLFYEYMY